MKEREKVDMDCISSQKNSYSLGSAHSNSGSSNCDTGTSSWETK